MQIKSHFGSLDFYIETGMKFDQAITLEFKYFGIGV
jgi:hypothetical protein